MSESNRVSSSTLLLDYEYNNDMENIILNLREIELIERSAKLKAQDAEK
jgi:hypothetical protein